MEANTSSVNKVWSPFQKLSFRFSFVFFSLIIFPFPLFLIPGADVVTQYYSQAWEALVSFTGKNFLGIEEDLSIVFNGSGDRLYDWVWYFCVIALTLIIASVFSLIDRKRKNYETLKSWFDFTLFHYLAYFMFVYGIIKLFYLQFGPPSLERLFQTFGQASPMRLLWTFMGFSETYTVFSGFCETLAGVLLLFRKTRTLGALIAIGVTLNIFLLNMSYDVPVKLFSFQLMLVGIYIASRDWKRILNFFILNRNAAPSENYPVIKSQRGKWILLGVQILFAGFVIYNQVSQSIESRQRYGAGREKSALYGVYNVDRFTHNHDTLPPLTTDTVRWKRVLFDYPQFTSIILMNDHVKRYNSKIDTVAKTITLSERSDTINKYELNYLLVDKNMRLEGVLLGDTLDVELENYDINKFGLLNRGFNWVNEVPYNRYNYD